MSNDQRPASSVPFDPTAHKQRTHETSWLGATGRHGSKASEKYRRWTDRQTTLWELWGGAPCARLSEAWGTNDLNRGGGRGAPGNAEGGRATWAVLSPACRRFRLLSR